MKKLLIFCFYLSSYSLFIHAQCSGTEPVVSLGDDTLLCQGQSVTLGAPAGYDSYLWSTSQTSQVITVNQPGTYIVAATISAGNNNLVLNGDFESGNTGFTSSYGYVSTPWSQALWNPGLYAVDVSPNDYHSNFYACGDHTSGAGKMYIANGASTANTVIWSQTIAVIPNTNYNFSAWVASVENTTSPAVMQFFVNGTQIGNVFSPSSTGCEWGQFFNLWNSGTSTSAVISIVNQNTEPSGNDFAIDDISFIPYCTNSDTIQVTYDPITVNAGNDLTFCSDDTQTLTATSNDAAASFSWSSGENSSTITPTQSGAFTVTATSANGCVVTDVVNVTINQTPDAKFTSSTVEGQIPLAVDFTNTSVGVATYSWLLDHNLSLSGDETTNYSVNFTEEGSYIITLVGLTAAGCIDSMQVTIHVTDEEWLQTPNVFTPDSDGANDAYHFNMENIKSLELTIFNRWGQEVRFLNDVNASWDGKDTKGNDLNGGIYYYIYKAEGGTGTQLSGQGFIQLVR